MTDKTAVNGLHARTRLTYDHANRLVAVEQGGVDAGHLGDTFLDADLRIDYRYDAEGKLVERTETWLKAKTVPNEFGVNEAHAANAVTTQRYVYDGNHVWADLNGTNQWTDHYVYGQGIDTLLARVRSPLSTGGPSLAVSWYLTDRQGSVTNIVDASVAAYLKRLIYTGVSASTRAGTLHDRFEYTGREVDFRAGLQNNRARWLHLASGRFVSEDSFPASLTGENNPYRYAGNSWPNASDPSGHLFWFLIPAVLGGFTGEFLYQANELSSANREGRRLDRQLQEQTGTVSRSDPYTTPLVAFGQGLRVGAKANVNGLWHTAQSLATLGLMNEKRFTDLWEVTDQDRLDGYDRALGFSRFGFEVLTMTGAAKLGQGAGLLGKVGRGAMWVDTVRNVNVGVEGAVDIYRNGLNLENGLKLLGVVGARGNLSQLKEMGAAGRVGRVVEKAEALVGRGVSWTASKAYRGTNAVLDWGIHKQLGGTRLHDPLAWAANKVGFRVCFVAGTPLEGQYGAKAIEQFKSYEEHGDECDYVVSRNEFDPEGPLALRRVLRRFVRQGPVLNLHVNGRIIGTTPEHPFFVQGKGWVPAVELQIGDEIRQMSPGWATVEGVAESGEITTVYNLEVEDDHTYFVGCDEWGFSVWAHNEYSAGVEAALDARLRAAGLNPDARSRIIKVGKRPDLPASHGDAWAAHWDGDNLTNLGKMSHNDQLQHVLNMEEPFLQGNLLDRVNHAVTRPIVGSQDLDLQWAGRVANDNLADLVHFNRDVLQVGVNPFTMKLKATPFTEIDTELTKALIEVTTQRDAAGKVAQLRKYLSPLANPTGKPVFQFMPNLTDVNPASNASVKALIDGGSAGVFNDLAALKAALARL